MKTSIIIPHQNKRPGMLKEALASIEAQTVKPIEVIQATDESLGDERINDAISRAIGEYILILSDDDMLTPLFIEETEKALDMGYDIACTFIELFGAERGKHGPGQYPFFTSLFKKSIWERVGGFDCSLGATADVDFWHRCLIAGARIFTVPDLVYMYRKHPDQVSNKVDWEESHKKFREKNNL